MRREISREIATVLKEYEKITGRGGYAVFIHDTKGNIFEVNKRAEKLTGYSRRELLNMNVKDLHTAGELRKSVKKLSLIDEAKKEVKFQSQFRKKNGGTIDVKITGDKFVFKNNNFVIGVVKDITAYRKLNTLVRKKDTAKPENCKTSLEQQLDKDYVDSVHLLSQVAEARDPYTVKHSVKVTKYAELIAKCLTLPERDVKTIKLASMVHDIGKIGIDQRILSKPTSLTDKEYKKVKKHPILSSKIIKRIPLAQKLIPIIKYHHENYDGTGYPSGLKGSRIPIGARILAIADVYDALTSRRAYREAYSHNKAIEIMKKDCGKKFDPEVFKKFVQITNFIHRKHYGKNAKLRTRAVFINYRDRDNKWK